MGGALLALVVGGGFVVVALRQARMSRGHRDVAGFSMGLMLTGLAVFATLTAIVAPGMWSGLYRFFVPGS